MLRIIRWFLGLGQYHEEYRKKKIEGKRTPPAKGRAKRLREAREYKESALKVGNRNTTPFLDRYEDLDG